MLGGGLFGAEDGHEFVGAPHPHRKQIAPRGPVSLITFGTTPQGVPARAVYAQHQPTRPGHRHNRLYALAVLDDLGVSA